MGDFDKFLDYLKKGDMRGVKETFHADFLNRPDDLNRRPIHWACIHGNADSVKFLIEQKCEIECKDNNGRTPLISACYNKNDTIAKILIDNKCNVKSGDYAKRTPLHHACYNKNVSFANILIANKCDIECEDDAGRRPIHHASMSGYVCIAIILIKQKCEIECKASDGWRPIHFACHRGHVDVATLLVEHKCDIECKDKKEWTPLHHACFSGHIDILKLLVGKGCELQCVNSDGVTALELAKQKNHKACEDFLTEAVKLTQVCQQPQLRKLENKEAIMESFKATLNNIFSDSSRLSRLKTWLLEKEVIPRGTLSRCHVFNDIFYEIWKRERYDLLIGFCKNELSYNQIGNVLECLENLNSSGMKYFNC